MKEILLIIISLCTFSKVYAQTDNITRKRSEKQNVRSQNRNSTQRLHIESLQRTQQNQDSRQIIKSKTYRWHPF